MQRLTHALLAAIACTHVACGEPDHSPGSLPAEHESGAVDDSSHLAAPDSHPEAMALRPIMQRLGSSMAGLQQALWVEDYHAMVVHANGISGHVEISEDEVARIRRELGEEMREFERADSSVHEASVRLRAAVEARNMDAILDELGQVQVGCISCHTAFRDRLRTDSLAR